MERCWMEGRRTTHPGSGRPRRRSRVSTHPENAEILPPGGRLEDLDAYRTQPSPPERRRPLLAQHRLGEHSPPHPWERFPPTHHEGAIGRGECRAGVDDGRPCHTLRTVKQSALPDERSLRKVRGPLVLPPKVQTPPPAVNRVWSQKRRTEKPLW
jgi:hypothetical protein